MIRDDRGTSSVVARIQRLHAVIEDLDPEGGSAALVDRLVPAVARALGLAHLAVELIGTPAVRVETSGPVLVTGDPTGDAMEMIERRLPLTARGHDLGLLVARLVVPRGSAADGERLLAVTASLVAMAVDGARTVERMSRRAAEEEALAEAGRLLAGPLDPDEIVRRLASVVHRHLGADAVRVFLSDVRGGMHCVAQAGDPRLRGETVSPLEPGEGVMGWVCRHRESLVTSDLGTDDRAAPADLVRNGPGASLLTAPLLLEDRPVGSLEVVNRRRRVFTPADVALVEALATAAAASVRQSRLGEESEHRRAGTEALLAVSQAVSAAAELPEIFRRTTREMVRVLGADTGGAWLLQGEAAFVPVAAYRAPRDVFEAFVTTPLPATDVLMEELRRLQGPVASPDSATDPRLSHPLFRLLPHRSLLVVPVRRQQEVVGTFILAWLREPHVVSGEELRLAEGMARQAAVVLDTARLQSAEREARELLAVSETLYGDLFANAIDLVFVHDLDGRILAANRAAMRASGYGRDELLGMNVARLMSAKDLARGRDLQARLVAGDKVREFFTFELLARNGTSAVVECAARVIRRDDAPVALQVVARDLSERRRLERRQAAILDIVKELSESEDVDHALALIGERACELVEADAAAVSLIDGDELVLRSTAGFTVPPDVPLRRPLTQSRRWRVIRDRRAYAVTDTAADPAWRDSWLWRERGFRSLLDLPIVLRGEVIGAFGVLRRSVAAFTEADVALITSLAEHVALVLERTELVQSLESRLREMETLLAVARAVSGTLDHAERLRRVARAIARALGADMVGAYLADDRREQLSPVAGYHVPPALVEDFLRHPIPIQGHPAMEATWRTLAPLVVPDVSADPRLDAESLARFPHRALLFVPMAAKGEAVGGFFAVWWKEGRLIQPGELRLVQAMSDQAAMSVDNARLYAEATRRRREAEELARLTRMLTESLDAVEVGQRIVRSALELLGGRFAVLRSVQPDGSLKLVACQGEPSAVEQMPPTLPPGTGVMGRAVTEGAPFWSADFFRDPRIHVPEELRPPLVALGYTALLAVPLRAKRTIMGTLAIGDATSRRFSEEEIALLQTFADQAAIALDNSRLYGELRQALRAVEESQQRVVRGERLRALGEMAGGIAHDFNNVLAIIVGRAEVLREEARSPALAPHVDVIVKVAMDAAQTVRRIQDFTRMRRDRPFQRVDVNELLDEIVDVTRSRWKDEAQSRGVTYDVVVEKHPAPAVTGDPSELREAMTNIIFNALDAMPEGGRVVLRTGVADDRVVCEISDTGVGMTEEVRTRIFDPFFTTKGERGTGLGLSVVYGIVARHKGEIDVQSAPGRGTSFIINLPASPADRSEVRPVLVEAARVPRRVLVIDDEVDVGAALARLLTLDGHSVAVCPSGQAGVARFEAEPYDLVITDLGMPGLSGWEVAQQVKSRRPGMPIILVTGWGDQIDPVEARNRGIDCLLPKPFTREELRQAVAEAFSPRPPGS